MPITSSTAWSRTSTLMIKGLPGSRRLRGRTNCTVAMGQGACLITELEMFNYKTPPYATAYPELPFIFTDHPGWPVGNVLAGDNVYCHAESPSTVRFMNVNPDDVQRGLSVVSDNTAETRCRPTARRAQQPARPNTGGQCDDSVINCFVDDDYC